VYPEGLEDFAPEDMVMPRLNISHTEGVYVDSLSGEKFQGLDVVLLGLIKQRILWPPEVSGDKEAPLCKSFNFTEGRPDPANPSRFPWKASGFSMGDYVKGDDVPPVLTCEGCKLKDWGTHPKTETPWCSEQHTFALLMQVGDGYSPAILTVQRTGIKPSKAYLTSFARSASPLFIVTTKLGLTVSKRGTVVYAVPTFTRGVPTPEEAHPEFAAHYRRIREFITTPTAATEGEEEGTPVAAPTPASPPPPGTTNAAGEEMPF
jgi:hypothetical protein